MKAIYDEHLEASVAKICELLETKEEILGRVEAETRLQGLVVKPLDEGFMGGKFASGVHISTAQILQN